MKKFSRVNKSSYSVFTVFIFLLIFACFLGFTFYFINSIFNSEKSLDSKQLHGSIKDKIKYSKAIESEKLAKDYVDKFTLENSPKISILVSGLGVDEKVTNQAIDKLPSSISLGFLPYMNKFDYLNNIDRDMLMGIPMETFDYFFHDSGPYSLICNLGEEENSRRLDFIISDLSLLTFL